MQTSRDPLRLYSTLGLTPDASAGEIKRAYRSLRTKAHPDKGGDSEAFNAVTQAYNVLSDSEKRQHYDTTGVIQRSAGEVFVEKFAGGVFSDRVGRKTAAAASGVPSVRDQIAVRQDETRTQSHTAGFEAWLRSRGSESTTVYTSDTIAEQFGVVKSSYQAVPLPAQSVMSITCRGAGKPLAQLDQVAAELPTELEWGQVLLHLKFAPVTPADIYSIRLGGLYDESSKECPFVAGHDGVAVVTKVGPGVKDLAEGDVVLPVSPLLGTWREAAVVKAKHLVKVGRLGAGGGGGASTASGRAEGAQAAAGSSETAGVQGQRTDPMSATVTDDLPLPLEYLAVHREMLLAYKLLEVDANMKPGDCVILNAPNSTVGRVLLQLCKLLKLRAVAVLRPRGGHQTAQGSPAGDAVDQRFSAVADHLTSLGATLVLKDEGSVKAQLQSHKFFGLPKLALDAVGGDSARRLAEALHQGGRLIVYGCLSGKSPSWSWQSWVFRGLQVSGFNLRKSLAADTASGAAKLRNLLESLGKLVSAGLLSVDMTEYRFIDEWRDAVEDVIEAPGGSRVMLAFDTE